MGMHTSRGRRLVVFAEKADGPALWCAQRVAHRSADEAAVGRP
ncbi:hypothetical protein [Streptomyces sp. NBC_00154]|nr:hypothetical protein [Streptomyces sp. NBC_00154]MCX5315048.1 hypothetical protein [Streptomyces sp. NBC_00154]